MKRNNIFMWAYISFIMFAILLRLFNEFLLWRPIVLAITVSSVFFALEDLFASLYHSLKDFLDIANSLTSEVRKQNDKDMGFLAKIDRAIPLLKESQYDVTNINYIAEATRKELLELDELICSIDKEIQTKTNTLYHYNKIAIVSAFIGFLCLFCTLIVATSLFIPEIAQEILTVMPFALILLTQQIKIISSKQNKKNLANKKSILEAEVRTDKIIDDTLQILDDLIENCMSEREKKQEVTTDAD